MKGKEQQFFKYQGTGNDFVILDQLEQSYAVTPAAVQWICDRHYGVGADGLMVLSSTPEADFDLRFYNPDGSESFCGNGSRCAVRFYMEKHDKKQCTFMAFDGLHEAHWITRDDVRIDLNITTEIEKNQHGYRINTGAPHLCVPTKDLEALDIEPPAKAIRWHEIYQPVGVNVNFFESVSPTAVKIRTFEKGVEGETLSCGTGVTAVAISVFADNPTLSKLDIESRGGQLQVAIDPENKNRYWLRGSAQEVFTGKLVWQW